MRRRTLSITLGAVVVAVVAAGFRLPLDGGDAGASGRGGDQPPATAAVVRTDLVRSKTVDGKLDFAQRRAVKSAVEGAPSRWPLPKERR